MHKKEEHFDIIIVGGGLAGASLASALKDKPFKIALIDQTPLVQTSENSKTEQTNALDARALALSHTSIEILKALQIWQTASQTASPLLEVHISKAGHFGVTRITAAEQGLSELGFVVSADNLNHTLNTGLTSISNLKIFRPDHIVKMCRQEHSEDKGGEQTDKWVINLNSMQSITGRLIVAADGTESYIRKTLGMDAVKKAYYQTALVVNLELNQSHQGIAYERFTDNGSIAFLPFGERRVKCVWVQPSSTIKEIKNVEQYSDEKLLTKIQEAFGYQLGRFIKLGHRTFYPLSSSFAQSLYDDGVVLIGNAANTLHPVVAQGFNLGLRDVATLAEHIILAKQLNEDFGSITVLKQYAESRKPDHQRIRQFTDSIAEPNAFQWLGILACEWLPFVKNAIAKRGLGISLPKEFIKSLKEAESND